MSDKKKRGWLAHCRQCHKSHIWEIGKCPHCGVHETPILRSENVKCFHREECDGCEAYREHQA